MAWYLPPAGFRLPHPANIPHQEAEVNALPVIKEGAKYLIPSAIVGVICKDFAARITTLPIENIIRGAGVSLQFGYISMVALGAFGLYKMAMNIEEQQNPSPETVTIQKKDYDKVVQENKEHSTENTRLLNEVEKYKQENAQLRSLIHNRHFQQ